MGSRLTDDFGYIFSEVLDEETGGSYEQIMSDKALTPLKRKVFTNTIYSREEATRLATRICAYVSLGKYTLESICWKFGVSPATFTSWAVPESDLDRMINQGLPLPARCIPEVHFMYKAAVELGVQSYSGSLKEHARRGLLKRVMGFEAVETRKEYKIDTDRQITDEETGELIENPNFGKRMLTKEQVKTSQIAPDVQSIIFALVNADKENFQNRVSATVEPLLPNSEAAIAQLSDEELDRRITEMNQALVTTKNE